MEMKRKFHLNEKTIPVEKALNCFRYDYDSGLLFWENPESNQVKKGRAAGTKTVNGYLAVKIGTTRVFVHRIAWVFKFGKWPDALIDHIDGNKTNNKIENLRETNHRFNQHNRLRHRKGLLPGAYRQNKKWGARIQIDGKDHYLGTFETQQEAHEAYLEKLKEVA
jgi:hypothetical protein